VVPCISAELQVEHHGGYPPRDRDRADMANLAQQFGVTLAGRYRDDPPACE
jgi:hypothetical protein